MSAVEIELRQDKLKKYVIISVVIHCSFFIGVGVKNLLTSVDPIDYTAAVRVDLVALPDKLPQEMPPTPEPETKKSPPVTVPPVEKVVEKVPPKNDAVNLEKTKSKQKDALAKLKQMSALEEIQKSLQDDAKSKPKKTEFKGNAISPGTAITGINKMQQDNYIATVNQHFRSRWELPEYLRNRNLSAQVVVRFDENGNIVSKQIVKTSGNNVFDDIALETVDKSSPVPVPPEKFTQIAKVQGFLFLFAE